MLLLSNALLTHQLLQMVCSMASLYALNEASTHAWHGCWGSNAKSAKLSMTQDQPQHKGQADPVWLVACIDPGRQAAIW